MVRKFNYFTVNIDFVNELKFIQILIDRDERQEDSSDMKHMYNTINLLDVNISKEFT